MHNRTSLECVFLISTCLFAFHSESIFAIETLEQQLLAEPAATLAEDAQRIGDPVRGATIFYARALACSTCHSVGDRPESIGPDLSKIEKKTTNVALIEAILLPSKSIAPNYATVSIVVNDGRVITGLPVSENEQRIVLRDLQQTDKLITIDKADIEDRKSTAQSIMPAGQVNQLSSRGQFLDLIRYLIEVRDGGLSRARELQPPPDPLAQKIPDEPLPWQPVVQRGEVAVAGKKYPHAVALGFSGGTVLFDANQLHAVATWRDGFVTHTQQNYFGLNWHQAGSPPEQMSTAAPLLTFKLSEETGWQAFEPAATSDPNVGTRFDGYQIGKSSVRLRYRLLVGTTRISVTEDVRAETRSQWQGFSREYRFHGLPADARVAFAMPVSIAQLYSRDGREISWTDNASEAPLLGYSSEKSQYLIRVAVPAGGRWRESNPQDAPIRLISGSAKNDEPVALRIDQWKYQSEKAGATELAALVTIPPQMNDSFDQPLQPLQPPPPPELVRNEKPSPPAPQRPAVQANENIDEFPPVRGRFLRFVITKTNDGSEPGIDELEVYGSDSDTNLALAGRATASSVIAGYKIHQIPHLNDGKLGNTNSWISAERAGGWAQIEFSEPVEMQKIVWARDRTGTCKDRLPVAYRIEISDDGQKWSKVGDESGRIASTAVGTIRRDASPGYVMEAIPSPFPACRPSDIVFSDDGTLYAIAMTEGQIWRTRTPPSGHPEQVKWQRFASGLYHPLGLAMIDGRLYVAQKPEITELIDRDGDGQADQYRTVATGWGLSTGWHEYCFGLAVDPQKNLLFALNTGYFWTNPGFVNPGRWRGSILRVEHNSEKLAVVATGCRVPNGIAQGPEGNIFFTDNQGDWIQACKLAHVVPGRFYGHPETKEDALPKEVYPNGRSSIWLPYERCRSVSGPAFDATQQKFGPFSGQMFVGDVGYGANAGIMRVALEKVNGEYQGACFPFVDGQPQGCERMRFGPDNQLYSTSLTTGITRMAFAGETPFAIQTIRIRPKGVGFEVQLTKPLAEDNQLTTSQFKVVRYHYLYTGNYGSPKADEQGVPVEKLELSEDRKLIKLTLPVESYPIGMVYEINLGKLTSSQSEVMQHSQAWYTVHQIPD